MDKAKSTRLRDKQAQRGYKASQPLAWQKAGQKQAERKKASLEGKGIKGLSLNTKKEKEEKYN
jgi:hypothetical protein